MFSEITGVVEIFKNVPPALKSTLSKLQAARSSAEIGLLRHLNPSVSLKFVMLRIFFNTAAQQMSAKS